MINDPALAASVHALLEWAGMATGFALWRRILRREGAGSPLQPGRFAVLVGLLLGAGLGNKAVFLIERPDIALRLWQGEALWPGQSIVGGLLGGWLGVELAKALTGQTRSTGDAMVLPLACGLMIGRLGCWLAGLHDDTYGLPTSLPWGIDLGDGVPRHPSPLYEIAFLATLTAGLLRLPARRSLPPGWHFKCFACAYLLWRLLADTLKPVRVPYPLGLSGIQWVCLLALALCLPLWWRSSRQAGTAASALT
jgi:phosphatidylglycerol:prolipoprotein diacylglycerol transferase